MSPTYQVTRYHTSTTGERESFNDSLDSILMILTLSHPGGKWHYLIEKETEVADNETFRWILIRDLDDRLVLFPIANNSWSLETKNAMFALASKRDLQDQETVDTLLAQGGRILT